MSQKDYTDLSRDAIIKQPTTYTLMPKKVTLTGLKVFAIVMTRLQGFFNDAIAARQQRGTVQPAQQQLYLDFTPRGKEFEIVKEDREDISKGDVRFTIKFRELGIAPKNYPAAFQTLLKMAYTPVRIPLNGKVTYTTLMRIDVEAGENAVVLPDGRVDYIKPEVSLVVPRVVANRIFNVELMGYDQYFLHTALYSKSIYTFYIYVFLSGQWFRGHSRVEKDYEDFRAEVGLYDDPNDPDPKRRRAGQRYKAWGQFCQSVLEPARLELDDSCKRGHAPLSFAYEPLYGTRPNARTGRNMRTVTHIVFTILPAEGFERQLADKQSSPFADNTMQDNLYRFLHQKLKLSNDQATKAIRQAFDLAGTDGIRQLADKANFLYDTYVVKKTSQVKNLGAACKTAIDTFLTEEIISTPKAEIVTDASDISPEEAHRLAQAAISGTPADPSRLISSPAVPSQSRPVSSPAIPSQELSRPGLARPLTATESSLFQRVCDALADDRRRGIFADERTQLWAVPVPDILGTSLLRICYDAPDTRGHDMSVETPMYLAHLFRHCQTYFTLKGEDGRRLSPVTEVQILIRNRSGRYVGVARRALTEG